MEADSELILYLFFEGETAPVLPPPYEAAEQDGQSVCLRVCDDMAALNNELLRAIRVLEQVSAESTVLSIYRCEKRAVAATPAVHLSAELLRRMAARGVGLDYSLYMTSPGEPQFPDVMSFFLLTFPQGGAAEVPTEVPWLYGGEYRGQYFVLTPDMYALAEYLIDMEESGQQLPELRVDYFSAGSAVMWYLEAEAEIRALAALGCEVELRVHHAMILPPDDPLSPLFGHLMGSSEWRSRLLQPEDEDESCQ